MIEVALRPQARWREVTREQLEMDVGVALPPIPVHSKLVETVLRLGGEATEHVTDVAMTAYPIGDLPPPWDPFRCAHAPRFHRMLEQARRQEVIDIAAHALAGRRFRRSLTASDFADCTFHRADWAAVAAESVRLLEAMPEAPTAEIARSSERAKLEPEDRRWLRSLFSDPIQVRGQSYLNGQHRGCALWASGAATAAIATGDRVLGVVSTLWQYSGDG